MTHARLTPFGKRHHQTNDFLRTDEEHFSAGNPNGWEGRPTTLVDSVEKVHLQYGARSRQDHNDFILFVPEQEPHYHWLIHDSPRTARRHCDHNFKYARSPKHQFYLAWYETYVQCTSQGAAATLYLNVLPGKEAKRSDNKHCRETTLEKYLFTANHRWCSWCGWAETVSHNIGTLQYIRVETKQKQYLKDCKITHN